MSAELQYEAIVIGTGFGGAVTACRLSRQWPGKVLVLERGKRYGRGEFPRSPYDTSRNFWNIPEAHECRPKWLPPEELHGLYDIRSFHRMDVIAGAGLGGGSLIYANVFGEPPSHVFGEHWPSNCKLSDLQPYYRIAKAVLGSRPLPPANGDPFREVMREKVLETFAQTIGKPSELVDINVFFGPDANAVSPRGKEDLNPHGALQTSCNYCGECWVGCNVQAKNTLDLNYLFAAEKKYSAQIETECLAKRIVPLRRMKNGQPDPQGELEVDDSADGQDGYQVTYECRRSEPMVEHRVRAKRVIVAASTLGSTEFLLRSRDLYRTLPRISSRLGRNFSGNGDFLNFAMKMNQPSHPTHGPVITRRVEFDWQQPNGRHPSFILEDFGYAYGGSWFLEGAKPGAFFLGPLLRSAWHVFWRMFGGRSVGSVGWAFQDLLGTELTSRSYCLLGIGVDSSDGVMELDQHGQLDIHWPVAKNMPLYESIIANSRAFGDMFQAKSFPLPTWSNFLGKIFPWLHRNVTAHPLGGCSLGENPESGVTNAAPQHFGEVFGYHNLFVADGSLVPSAVGANPSATIAALAERVAEGITHQRPTAVL